MGIHWADRSSLKWLQWAAWNIPQLKSVTDGWMDKVIKQWCWDRCHEIAQLSFSLRHFKYTQLLLKHWLCGNIFKLDLTHWGRDIVADISQTTISNEFFWMKMCKFWLRFHWSLFPRVKLTIFHHQYSAWSATSHYLNQWWLRLVTHICVTRPQWVQANGVSTIPPMITCHFCGAQQPRFHCHIPTNLMPS